MAVGVRRAARVAVTVVLVSALVPVSHALAAPKRVVALTPFSANTLAGLGVRPVAIGQTLGGSERFAPQLEGARVLPLAHPNGPNMEQLAELQPGLVFSSPTWRKGAQTMRRLGMRVEEVDPYRVTDTGRAVERIGKIVGRSSKARALAAQLSRDVAAATRNIRRRPRILLVLGVGRTPYAFLPNSWGGDIVGRAGGRLVTGGVRASGGFARISDEKVVEENPDVIVAVPHGSPRDLGKIEADLKRNRYWQLTNAGESGRIHVSTDNSLLQAGTDVGRVIRQVRQRYLKNW